MTAFERITDALYAHGSKVVSNGTRARAQCPVHNSRGLSLAVRSRDGRAQVTCFAGCRDEEVLDAIGLRVADLFDQARSSEPAYDPRALNDKVSAAADLLFGTERPPLDHILDRMQAEQLKVTLGPGVLSVMGDPDDCDNDARIFDRLRRTYGIGGEGP